ncbi:YecR-like lipofamily protein [Yokenella regensburgei]|uniref:YecR family lipoprotein n=1 Tax=Yokenella regensburgei TaxID=158877 RepID=UPI003F165EA4
MNKLVVAAALLLLTGCTITKEPKVSSVDTTSGIVRLNFSEAMMQSARYDSYTTQGTANKQCQQMGYATAVAYGQPVSTCSVYSGSVCMNTTVTLQYQCRGVAFNQTGVAGTPAW